MWNDPPAERPPTATDLLVKEIESWSEERRGAVYYVLYQQGIRIDRAQELWRKWQKQP